MGTMSITEKYKDYKHPKANAKNFWNEDWELQDQEIDEENDVEIFVYKNSGGRIKILEKGIKNANTNNIYYPGGGTSWLNFMLFTNHNHIEWEIPKDTDGIISK
jgi:rhodanese-related sulfurtransferase